MVKLHSNHELLSQIKILSSQKFVYYEVMHHKDKNKYILKLILYFIYFIYY